MQRRIKETNDKKKFKLYINNFISFYNKNLKKPTGVLIIVSIFILAFLFLLLFEVLKNAYDENLTSFYVGFFEGLKQRFVFLLLILISGVAPFFYIPVLGFVLYLYNEFVEFTQLICQNGVVPSTFINLIPILINIFSVSLITATGIYLCKLSTVKYKLAQAKNMNATNFLIRIYQIFGNEKKLKETQKKQDKKIEKIQSRDEKINYLQMINIICIVTILQIISLLIQKILV